MTTHDTTAEFINKITRTWRTSKKLVVTAAALLMLSITIVAVVRQAPVPATRVPICVKNNGQLRMLVRNNTACDPSEQLTEWVVGGQITDIRLGQGLVGRRDDGIVSLDLDPAILQDCAGCGRIFAGFNDGPGEITDLGFGRGDCHRSPNSTCLPETMRSSLSSTSNELKLEIRYFAAQGVCFMRALCRERFRQIKRPSRRE